MKPDGADTATMEATVALGADPVIEVAPLGEGQEQAPPTSQTEGIGQGEPQPAETPAAVTKPGKPKPADPKAKTKAGSKTKTPTKTSAASARPATAPIRITNGVQKPQTNGVAKKNAPEKKTTLANAPSTKKPAAGLGTTKAPGTKPAGATRPATAPANGTKTASTTQPAKKTTGAPTTGDKIKPKATAPKPASAGNTKPSTTSSPKTDRPPVAKNARPAAGPPASRPASAAVKPATTTTSKTSTSASKPSAVAKTATSTAKPSPAKTTAPPAGRTPTQPSKTTTPIKKDVSKPSTPAAKKPAASPVSRPATTKTTKPETPKAATPAKPESASKKPSAPSKAVADAKSSKPKDSKPTPSKEVSASPKTPNAKNNTAKMASPKKTVGSSTPVPVKRGPKAAQTAEPAVKESEKEDVAPFVETATMVNTVAAATAIGAFTVATSELEVQAEPVPELAPEPKTELLSEFTSEVAPESNSALPAQPQSELMLKPQPEFLLETEPELVSESKPESEFFLETDSDDVAESKPEFLLETESELAPESKPESEFLLETESDVVAEPKPEFLLETKSELVPEPKHEVLLETESELVHEHKPEFLLETESELVHEHKPEFLLEAESEVPPESKPEFLSETKSELVLEPEPEFLVEKKSEFAVELKAENLVETKTEFLLEVESELVPEPETELQLETKLKFAPAPNSEFLSNLEVKSELLPEPLPDITHESTVDTYIPTPIEDRAQYTEDTQDIPSDHEEETTENLVTEVASHLDQGSLRQPISAPSPLGTTVMSPPSSPTEATPMEPKVPAPPLDMHASFDPWMQSEQLFSSAQNLEQENTRSQVDLLAPSEFAAEELVDAGKNYLLSTSPLEHLSSASPTSPSMEKEEAVEKAEQEINEDDHDGNEEEEEEEESGVVETQTMPQTQHVEDFKVGLPEYDTSGWGLMHSDEPVISSNQEKSDTSSPFQMESPQNDDVNDFFLKKVEMEQPFMGPPGVKSFSDEEEEEEEEDDDQVRQSMNFASVCAGELHMDTGLHAADDHHVNIPHHFKTQKEEEQEDQDVEMVSEGPMEIGIKGAGKVSEDDYDEGYLDNLNRTAPAPSMPMTAAWGSANPFADTWAQPASLHVTSSPLDVDADPETPTKSPAEAWLEQPLGHLADPHVVLREEAESSVPADGSNLAIPTVGMSQSSTLSGAALAAHSSSETSTPEELRDYDSSSGVESHSDKQQTPVPAAQPDQEQDLGIHLERGDGEEEEAETLPADEVLGDAPTAPASAPSSPSTSGDEASDTEGEMQINDPDAPADDTAAFDSPSASRNLPALEEDEEAADMHVGEEDGGTPQSANSVASYGFDCSVSNSNAHSTAESCGKSPGIFSLENEDQLPEEAKDPSLIKELTLPAAAAQPEDLLGRPVDLLPLSQQGESHAGLDHQYLLDEKTGASALEDVDPELPMHLSPQHEDTTDGQPPYYSAICDKTDSFLAGNV